MGNEWFPVQDREQFVLRPKPPRVTGGKENAGGPHDSSVLVVFSTSARTETASVRASRADGMRPMRPWRREIL